MMRPRGADPGKYWEPDPDAEQRWAASEKLCDAIMKTIAEDCGGPFRRRALLEALDEFWQSAYEAAIYRAKEFTGEELRDHLGSSAHDTP